MIDLKDKVEKYIVSTYVAKVEHPWAKFPEHTTFKDKEVDKWFALIMLINRNHLGEYGKKSKSPDELIPVINVKADESFIYHMSNTTGFMPGYHMNKRNWLTIFLDGTVSYEDIIDAVDMSYNLVTDTPTKHIYAAVKQIPKGHVATYGQVAEMAGDPNMARAVGNALHKNPDPDNIPCFRVVNSKGMLSGAFAFGGADEQAKRLRAEGVIVENNRVDLTKFGIGE